MPVKGAQLSGAQWLLMLLGPVVTLFFIHVYLSPLGDEDDLSARYTSATTDDYSHLTLNFMGHFADPLDILIQSGNLWLS